MNEIPISSWTRKKNYVPDKFLKMERYLWTRSFQTLTNYISNYNYLNYIRILHTIPGLMSSTGFEVSSAVYGIILEWSMEDKVQVMIVDITASNTVRLNGRAFF